MTDLEPRTLAEHVTIRRAHEADTATVVDLWEEAAVWLKAHGSDQWQYPVKVHNVQKAIRERACWIVENESVVPVATVTLDEHADPDLWKPTDDPGQALYVHRLVVGLSSRGGELGSAVLDWSSRKAKNAGKKYLRLDVWTSNMQLRQYYLDRGFTLVRIVPHIEYGVLFQRPAQTVLGFGPAITEPDQTG